MNANANDALVAALGIGALLALRSAPARGAFVALGAAAKFGSAALAPLFATADGERRWRGALLFSVAFVVVAVALVVPFIPDGGLREIYDRTLGYQATRSSPFSVWGQAPSLDFAAAGRPGRCRRARGRRRLLPAVQDAGADRGAGGAR